MTRAFAAVRALALGGALALGLGACGASPPKDLASQLAGAEDVVGKLFAELSLEGRFPYDDAALAAYVGGVGKRVVERAGLARRTWSFQVLDESEVNAYALLGGHAYVTRGMLAILDSEAELAAVLAHEMAHVTAGHGIQTISDLAAGAARADDPEEDGSARDKEYQADQLAIGYLAAAGYDPGTRTLVVLFTNGKAYQYQDVPPEVYQGLMSAESKGKYMRSEIIGTYTDSVFKGWNP